MCSWRSCGNVLKKETRRRVWNAYKLERLSLRRDVISVSIIQTNTENSLLKSLKPKKPTELLILFLSLCCIYSLFRAVSKILARDRSRGRQLSDGEVSRPTVAQEEI